MLPVTEDAGPFVPGIYLHLNVYCGCVTRVCARCRLLLSKKKNETNEFQKRIRKKGSLGIILLIIIVGFF